MDSGRNPAYRPRPTRASARQRWHAVAGLFALALALVWSGESRAQACDFVQLGGTSALALAGNQVSFQLEAQTACAATVNVAIAVTADTTGGANVAPPANPTVALNTPYTFFVNLGATPGGSGTVTATCLSGGCAGDVLTYTFATNNDFDFIASASTTLVANQITPFTLSTNLQLNGAPTALNVNFFDFNAASSLGSIAPDAAGDASITQLRTSPASYLFSASVVCPTLFLLEGCPPPPVDISVVVEAVALTAISPLAPATPPATPLALVARFGSASLPAPDGTNLAWSLLGQPAGGDGVLAGSAVAGGAGQSSATFSATVPGVYRVLADSGCTVCAVSTQTFTITVTAPSYVLARVTANPASGSVGAPLPVTVRLEQGGAPVPAATIQWTSTAPFAPAASTSATNAAGEASASFTPASSGSFTNAIAAQFDPDGIAANGDEVSVAFGANIGLVASLANTGGNNQSAPLNAAFAAPLQVNARNGGAPAAGVTITWTVTSGAATLAAPTSVTDAAGNAAIAITAGPTAGPVTVTASRQDDPSATVGYTLSVGALGSLGIVSGNGQQLTVGAPSAPLRVELKGAGGLPVAGAVVAWSTSTGTLASATSSTDAAGIASNTVTASAAGAVQVTASSALAAAPAVFSLNGALASLPGLTATQRSVADAIDQLCPALAALPAPTSPEQDLLLRCKELNTAAAIDPQATVTALDQLMANVALTQVNAAFSAAQSQFQNLKTRIAALRSGTGGTGFGGLAINTANGPVSLETLATAFANSADPVEVGGDFSRWGFFAAGNIGRGDADAGASSPAYDYDVDGVTAGVDFRKNDRWILGGSLGYTRQDTELPGDVGGLETRGWSVSAYSTYYQADSWYMDSVVTWGSNDYELLRQISYTLPVAGGGSTSINQVAKADSGGDLLSTAFTFGRDFNRGALGIGPYGRLLYTRLTFDDINEALLPGLPGNGLGLRIDNRDVSSLASVLGSKLTYTHSVSWGVLMPHLQLEWEHEFRDDPQAIEARFINDPTGSAMLVSGDPLDTDYFRLGLGLSMVLARGRSGFFYYEQLVGRNGMSQWNLAVGLRLEF